MLSKDGVTIFDFGEWAALSGGAAFVLVAKCRTVGRLTSSVGYWSRKSINHRSWPVHRTGRLCLRRNEKKGYKASIDYA